MKTKYQTLATKYIEAKSLLKKYRNNFDVTQRQLTGELEQKNMLVNEIVLLQQELKRQQSRATKYVHKYKREKRARHGIEMLFKELQANVMKNVPG